MLIHNRIIAHRTLSIRNSLISHLLPFSGDKNAINTVYSFKCNCLKEYIGETENLNKRIQEQIEAKVITNLQ